MCWQASRRDEVASVRLSYNFGCLTMAARRRIGFEMVAPRGGRLGLLVVEPEGKLWTKLVGILLSINMK